MERWEKIEFYVLLLTIAIGGIVSILDLADMLENIAWLKDRIPTITLLLATLIAGSLLIGTQNTRQFLKSVLPIGTIERFDSAEEALRYTLKRMREAKKGVRDLTWEKPFKTTLIFDDDDVAEYLGIIEEMSRRVRYREIIMLHGSEGRIKKVKRLIRTAGKYYQLAGYADLPEGSPPLWQFVIVDDEEVIFKDLAVRQPEIVDYFRRYYDSQWAAAIPIKIGNAEPNLELLEEAERRQAHKASAA
jgi:hypothetical protein